MTTLEQYVAGLFNITPELLFTTTRKREVVDARNICSAVLKDFTTATLERIGQYFSAATDDSDRHATALHRVRTAKNLQETDKVFAQKMSSTYEQCHKGFIELPFEMTVIGGIAYPMEEELYIAQLT